MKSAAVVCFGKLKTPGMAETFADFAKRLFRSVDFSVYELKPVPAPDKSEATRDQVLNLEKEKIEELISSKAFTQQHGKQLHFWVLDESGRAFPTLEWSKKLQRNWDQNQTPVFIIGSGLGLSDHWIENATTLVSFGPQTVSHELARILCIEQLYRAVSILNGHPYHNEG